MTRRTYIQVGTVLYEKGTEPHQNASFGPSVLPDLPDFVSPIDGKVYSGRTGMRDHCARHDVVPTAELKGLPWKTKATEYRPDRVEIRNEIVSTMQRKGYW